MTFQLYYIIQIIKNIFYNIQNTSVIELGSGGGSGSICLKRISFVFLNSEYSFHLSGYRVLFVFSLSLMKIVCYLHIRVNVIVYFVIIYRLHCIKLDFKRFLIYKDEK